MLNHLVLVLSFLATTFSSPDGVTLEGDLLIGGLFGIQNRKDNSCSDYSTSSLITHQAVRWTIERLNNNSFIPNVTLGLQAYKTCGFPERAVKNTINFVEMAESNSTSIFGVIGPDKSSEAQVVSRFLSSLPVDNRLLQISYSATAAVLADENIYNNLFRVIEADDLQVQVLVELLLEMNWNYVAVSYEDGLYGTDAAHAMRGLAESKGICIPIFQTIDGLDSIRRLREKLDIQSSPVSVMIYFGRDFLKELLLFLENHLIVSDFQLIVSEALSLDETMIKKDNGEVFARAKGLLTATPLYDPVEDFTAYWNNLLEDDASFRVEADRNPWLKDYFESGTGCKVSQVDYTPCWARVRKPLIEHKHPLYVSYAILAVSVLAETFKSVHLNVCKGQVGICSGFAQLSQTNFIREIQSLQLRPDDIVSGLFPTLGNVSFKGRQLRSDSESTSYQIFNYQRGDGGVWEFKEVASYNGSLNVAQSKIRSYDKIGSEEGPVDGHCRQGFLCWRCLPDPSKQILHIPGDFYIIGLVPVHNRHETKHFGYGSLRDSIGVDIVEAMAYAVHTMNEKKGKYGSLLGNKTIGLVVLDTANDYLIVSDRIISLHKGELDLGNGVMSSQILDKVIGYAGPLASSVAIPLSHTMKMLNQLYVGYATSAVELNDRQEYPTFLRTTSSLDTQVDPMMRVTKELEMTYIQVLYTNESYGVSGRDAVVKGASESGICVAQTVAVKESVQEGDYVGIANELRRYPSAKLVIVFSRSHSTPALMTAVNKEIQFGEFIFFGSGEGWAKRSNVIKHNHKLKGSLTMAQEIPVDKQFEAYFRNISEKSSYDPWVASFFEKKTGCYFPDSFAKKASSGPQIGPCTEEALASHHTIESWAPFAANAVYVLAVGFNQTLAVVCRGSLMKCAEYSTSDLIHHTLEVRLELYQDGNERGVFTKDGNGAGGFTITQIVQDGSTGDFVYRNVGEARNNSFLFDKTLLDTDITYASSCPSDYECGRCKAPEEHPDREKNTVYISVIVVESLVLLILTLLLIAACVLLRRQKDNYDKIDPSRMDPRHRDGRTGGGIRFENPSSNGD